MTFDPVDDKIYFPPPESKGGWRWLKEPEEIRTVAGIDPAQLDLLREDHESLNGGDSWSLVIIRHGYLVGEFHTFNVLSPTRFDIWSGTKSFTGTAWGLLLEDSRNNKLPHGLQVDLDSPAYGFIPDGHPLTDIRKEHITIRHLLTMTSGIPGSAAGLRGNPTSLGYGPFEHALGRCPNRFGRWANKLIAQPGTNWDYSDPAFAHLSLAFANIMGREISEYLKERIFDIIGIENLSWDVQGGSGFIGPHTNAHTGIHISARELARFGYLMLHKGFWNGQQIIPHWWIDLATKASQEFNPNYGYTWWVNTNGTRWPGLPRDAYALCGFRSNQCIIIPSLDIVIARVGSGPPTWDEEEMLGRIPESVIATNS
jgi:CubicO group peptidase (beta-lactamase class C family)